MVNNSPLALKGVVLYDVLPNNGYAESDPGDAHYLDLSIPRNSQFIDYLRAEIIPPTGFDVLYWTGTPEYAPETAPAAAGWKTLAELNGRLQRRTAFRIKEQKTSLLLQTLC